MNTDHEYLASNSKNKDQFNDFDKSILRQIGFLFLVLFIFFRPLSLILANFRYGGVSLLEIFSVGTFYIMLILLLINLKRIPFDQDIAYLYSILYVMFC
jgi:hypothetical protein